MNQPNRKLFLLSKKIKGKFLQEKIYQSYGEALKKCSSNGYENREIINLVKAKAKAYRLKLTNQSAPLINTGVLALLELTHRINTDTNRLIIFDLGGADGIYYLQLRKCVPASLNILWYVIETPEMVDSMKEMETDELKFYSSIDSAKEHAGSNPDIFHTSGTLQYTPQPIDILKEICKTDSKYLVFNRQSLIKESYSLISIQDSLLSWHGEGDLPDGFRERIIKYPHTNISQEEFEKVLLQKYRIIYTFEDPSGIKRVNKNNIVGLCYVCELK